MFHEPQARGSICGSCRARDKSIHFPKAIVQTFSEDQERTRYALNPLVSIRRFWIFMLPFQSISFSYSATPKRVRPPNYRSLLCFSTKAFLTAVLLPVLRLSLLSFDSSGLPRWRYQPYDIVPGVFSPPWDCQVLSLVLTYSMQPNLPNGN